jgi:hypothetical protein
MVSGVSRGHGVDQRRPWRPRHDARRAARRRRPGIIKSIAGRVDSIRAGQRRSDAGKAPVPAAGPAESRVAMLFNDASTFTVSTMETAEQYAKDLGLTPIVTAYNGTAYPAGRILPLLREVKRLGVSWLLVMSLDPDGIDAARCILAEGMDLDVKWITSAPASKLFLPSVGIRGAEFFMVCGGGAGRGAAARGQGGKGRGGAGRDGSGLGCDSEACV